ncbi:sensor histidine kinase, partial [Klebsiella pneumoniae]|uniref:sensor histidine kinase n=1 Tax=Klebsiella pneumoniae TaxID=573 RepID=UPI00301411A4
VQARQAGLAFEIHDNAKGVAIADKLKLLRIGRNLLSNAIKYSSSGTVMLRTEYMKGTYTLSVSDNGTGMTKEQIANIFKAFHRL